MRKKAAKPYWIIQNLAGLALAWDPDEKLLKMPVSDQFTHFPLKRDADDALDQALEVLRGKGASEPEKFYSVRKVMP